MLEAPYRKDGLPYDEYFEQGVKAVRSHIDEKDDDHVILLIGETGSGKSNLGLHALDIYMNGEPHIDQIAMSQEELATSMKRVATAPKPRALDYDEANVNKRSAMGKWNRDLLDLYYSNRGLNIFHVWCNPSLEMMDKPFIQDRIKAIIFVTGKESKTFRYYYYFKKGAIEKIYQKYGALNIRILSKVRKKYAWYRGWFKKYTGPLAKAYLDKKENRMQVKVDQFFEKYGEDDRFKTGEVARALGMNEQTLKNHIGALTEGLHYTRSAAGRYNFTGAAIEFFRSYFEQRRLKTKAEMRFNSVAVKADE